jgi:hypothetical protein
MTPDSLRLRLLLAAAGTVFLAMVVAWLVMTVLFARHIERRVTTELTRDAMQLIAHLRTDAEGVPHIGDVSMDERYDAPTSGLYWQVSTPNGVAR